jgi:hypothetical protein
VTTAFTYDANRRWLMRIATKNAAGLALINTLYGRDLSGRIIWVSGLTAGESWDYGYDTPSRLTFVNNGGDDLLDETFSNDLAGNMLSRSRMGAYAYPSPWSPRPHTPVSVGSRAFTYGGFAARP